MSSQAAILAQLHSNHSQSQSDSSSDPAAGSSMSGNTNPPVPSLDEEAFPALGGAPKPLLSTPGSGASTPPTWGGKSFASAGTGPASGAATPGAGDSSSSPANGASNASSVGVSLPGQHIERIRFAPSQLQPSHLLKKPLREILKDVGRRNKTTVEMHGGVGGDIVFEARGWASTKLGGAGGANGSAAAANSTSASNVRKALMEIASEVGSKQSVTIPIPASARPYLIGRGGSTIQGIHERTGARIQIPKTEVPASSSSASSDITIPITITGDAVTAELARREITALLAKHEKSTTTVLRVTDVPAELFPFIRGVHSSWTNELAGRLKVSESEEYDVEEDSEGAGIKIEVPVYAVWGTAPPPPEPEVEGDPVKGWKCDARRWIEISGERRKVYAAKTEIERRAREVAASITLRNIALNKGQHQFILGEDVDAAIDSFLAETGCTVLLPPEQSESESVTIIGPADKIDAGVEKAMDLATSMRMSSVDLSRQHASVAYASADVTPAQHAAALTKYLKQRSVLSQLEKLYDARIVVPGSISTDNTSPVVWEFGVWVLVPETPTPVAQDIFLVHEGNQTGSPDVQAQGYRSVPGKQDLETFKQGLNNAKQHILSKIGDPADVTAASVQVPQKYHDKLRRFIGKTQTEAAAADAGYIPVKISALGEKVNLRGRSAAVADLVAKIEEFVEMQKKDDLERGYTVVFDYPGKHINQLIGRKGENINKLREEFDVEIQVVDDKNASPSALAAKEIRQIEVKGPKAKADACKARIIALGKKLEDEATHVIKVPAKYHGDLIGPKGSQVNRLQDRYHIRVQFPRTNAAALSTENDDAASDAGRPARPTQGADEIVIRGPKRGADAARDELLSLYQWIVDNSHTATVSVQRSQVPSLIGQGGREMDRLRAETGAQIDVPAAGEGEEKDGRVEIRIKGNKKQVDEAKKILSSKARDFDETVVKTITIDKKKHLRALIGAGGSNIRRIVVEAGGPADNAARIVRFPNQDSEDDVIRVEGKAGVVDGIISRIEEFVKSREDHVTETVDVPTSQHRKLIGRGGDARRALEEKFGVTIDVPRQGSGKTDVKIKGPSKKVAEAKEHILTEVVVEEAQEKIDVPVEIHRIIVAENASVFRRLRTDLGVNVDHAGVTPPSRSDKKAEDIARATNGDLPLITDDPSAASSTSYSWSISDTSSESDDASIIPWILSGPAAAVPKAVELVNKAITSAKQSQSAATGYLILPDPKTYRFVVGPGGSKINEIRKKTGCKIQVPKSQSQGEAIEIKGKKEKLEEAKDLILEAVEAGVAGGR
ncbi:K liklik [Ascosphaera apis ARSEF 7405]|uniref:K liklik n=1 Tax=Ascosphaera apis ARSEF 7405 TaxID=392613 RepID=A0A166N2R0_9EURO|nr:K liklik [Ascosphaera apis ARSEF 7405]